MSDQRQQDNAAVQREIDSALGVYRNPGQKRNVSGENGLIAHISTHAERNDLNKDQSLGTLIDNQRSRDAVLFYARQDAAHAVLNTAAILGRLDRIERWMWALLALGLAGVLAILALCVLLVAHR